MVSTGTSKLKYTTMRGPLFHKLEEKALCVQDLEWYTQTSVGKLPSFKGDSSKPNSALLLRVFVHLLVSNHSSLVIPSQIHVVVRTPSQDPACPSEGANL